MKIASIGMVLGAGWAGARACTSTSGPGISLMSEFVGLSWFAEIPGVIFDVQRVRTLDRAPDSPPIRVTSSRRSTCPTATHDTSA